VTCELIGVVALVILLFTHAHRGPSAVLHQTGATGGLGAFIVSALMAAYVMVGFDSAGELSEETRDPRRTAPRSILRALFASGIGGALLLLAAILAAPSLTNGDLATGGLPFVLTSQLGNTVGKVLLADVAIAICVCTLAIQTAATRMMFSMSRDRMLPYSRQLGRVSGVTGTPVIPAIVVGALAIALLLVNVGEASLFTALASVCIVMLYGAYLMVTLPMLVRRLRGWSPAAGEGLFSLGRFGLAINAGAVLYGAAMMVNIGWPRASVYDPNGGHWYLRWFALLFVGASLLLGVAARAQVMRARRAAGAPELGELAGAEAGA
jgi:urea carboxylase system permease